MSSSLTSARMVLPGSLMQFCHPHLWRVLPCRVVSQVSIFILPAYFLFILPACLDFCLSCMFYRRKSGNEESLLNYPRTGGRPTWR